MHCDVNGGNVEMNEGKLSVIEKQQKKKKKLFLSRHSRQFLYLTIPLYVLLQATFTRN